MLSPAVTHSVLIAPCSRRVLAALHQRCHVIVMREELMVKGDTTTKTSSGKLSAAGGGSKGSERDRPAAKGWGRCWRCRCPAQGWWQCPWGFGAGKSSCHIRIITELRALAPLRTPRKDFL